MRTNQNGTSTTGRDNANGDGNGRFNVLGPGGVRNLALDMAAEFPGTVKDWKSDIRDTYRYRFNYGRAGGNGGGNNNNPRNPGNGDGTPTIHDTSGSHNRAAMPVTFPLGFQGPAEQPQPMAQRPAPQISPEFLSLIRSRMMGV